VPSSGASVCLSPWLRPQTPARRGPASTGPDPGHRARCPHLPSPPHPPFRRKLDTATVIVRPGQGLSVDARARPRRHPRPLPPGRHHLRRLHSDRLGRRGRVGRGVLRPGRYPAPARRPRADRGCGAVARGRRLMLPAPRVARAVHDFGWVFWEFREFAAIRRSAGVVHSVVRAID
jgi:hypothetical protein